MNRFTRFAPLAIACAVALTGCQSAKQLANCPVANILASASSLTEFRPGMEGDPSGELYSVQLSGVTATCDFDKDEGTTDSNIELTFRATRAPSGEQMNRVVPYFVASMQDGATVLNKQILAASFSFLPGEASVTFTETIPSTVIKLSNGKKPYDYSLLVGLQITRDQLNYNGRSTP